MGRGLRPGAAPCKFRSWRRRKKGFSFFPVYLMAEEGGVSLQSLLISQGFVWGAVEGAHTWQSLLPTGSGSVSSGAAQAGLGSKVCVQGMWPAPHAGARLQSALDTPLGLVCAPTCVHGRYSTDSPGQRVT